MIRFPRVRVLEYCVLGHGPRWIDYYATALAPLCRELTVCFPDRPAYRPLEAAARRWASEGKLDVRLEPIPFPEGTRRLDSDHALARACAPGVELCFITFLDLLLLQPNKLPASLAEERPMLWGTWFHPVDPAERLSRFVRRAFSKRARKMKHAARIQKNPPAWLDGAFFLDPLMAERVNLSGHKRMLPDPWPTRPRQRQREARDALGLPSDAKLFFHFGVADKRKGLKDTIAAWSKLPEDAVLLRAGPLREKEKPALQALERAGRAIVHDRFVPDEKVDLYYRAADWILLPYRRTEGSSGILSAAAAAQRPVIAADYGVIGHRVRAEGLGELHAHASARSLAAAVRRALEQPITRYAAALDAFAEAHTLPAFYEAFRAAYRE